jgi:hypothetical protein
MSEPEAEYVHAKGWICPVQTDLAVPRKFGNHQKKPIIDGFGV